MLAEESDSMSLSGESAVLAKVYENIVRIAIFSRLLKW